MSISKLRSEIIYIIRCCKFKENPNKIRIAGPGSKKLVLGLLVDGNDPRISKETYKRIDRHLHAIKKYGLASTATHEGFDSAYGFYNHLCGLMSYVNDVDKNRWQEFSADFLELKLRDSFFISKQNNAE
jgi:RNA-directed DNA polymerase